MQYPQLLYYFVNPLPLASPSASTLFYYMCLHIFQSPPTMNFYFSHPFYIPLTTAQCRVRGAGLNSQKYACNLTTNCSSVSAGY